MRAQTKRIIARFVDTEIDTGLMFCELAREPSNSTRNEARLESARKALGVAEEWIWKLDMPHEQFNQLTAKMEKLRFELMALEKSVPTKAQSQRGRRPTD